MTDDDLREVLSFGAEQRGVEFKAAGDLSDANYRVCVVAPPIPTIVRGVYQV